MFPSTFVQSPSQTAASPNAAAASLSPSGRPNNRGNQPFQGMFNQPKSSTEAFG
jgi:hypothetical protein